MPTNKSIVAALAWVALGVFGLSVSLVGLAYTVVYPGSVSPAVLLGAAVALLGFLLAVFSTLEIKY